MANTSAGLVLASASPRRRDLLLRLNVPFTVSVSGIEESIAADLPVEHLVGALAEAKARAVASVAAGVILAADTVVLVGDDVLGKPRDAADATEMLRRLRGRVHEVLTGVAVLDASTDRIERRVVSTQVTMRDVGDVAIARYLATGEPLDKAGGYAIQGRGGALVAAFAGCFANVVGLPLCEVASLLAEFGVQAACQGPICLLPGGWPCPRLAILDGGRRHDPIAVPDVADPVAGDGPVRAAGRRRG
jgi:septum formation protein